MQSYYSPFAIDVNERSPSTSGATRNVPEIVLKKFIAFFLIFMPGKKQQLTYVRWLNALLRLCVFFSLAKKRVKVCIYILQAYRGRVQLLNKRTIAIAMSSTVRMALIYLRLICVCVCLCVGNFLIRVHSSRDFNPIPLAALFVCSMAIFKC